MLELFLNLVLMVSLAGVIIIGTRIVPRVPEPKSSGVARFEKWVESLPLDRVDLLIRSWIHKSLRKIRLLVLRFDNQLNGYLEKTKDNGNGVEKKGVNDLLAKNGKK